MSTDRVVEIRTVGLDEIREHWKACVFLGSLIALLGLAALTHACIATLWSVRALSALLVLTGLVAIFHGFSRRQWGGSLIDIFLGLLYLVGGVLMAIHPAEAAIGLTLLVAFLLFIGGGFRIAAAVALRFPHWPWVVMSGIISIALGVLIYAQWPLSGVWVLGLFLGVDMLLSGLSMVALGLTVRNAPASAT